MQRFAKYDVSRDFATPGGRLAAQLVFGAVCAGGMLALRSFIDIWVPTAGPFALVYPTVVIATLYGHWKAGLVAYVISFFWAWYFVLPAVNSFEFVVPTDPSRVAINAIAALVVGVLAESFRRAVAEASAAREAEIERRGILLAELEHRTKNNFALVVSLLQMQKRRAKEEETKQALEQAISRVHTFAGAYTNLASTQGEGSDVHIQGYLHEIAGRIAPALFDDNVTLKVEADDSVFPRETAVAMGLFMNEALTNCAKYAFPGRRAGNVAVRLSGNYSAWELQVRDDGVGGDEAVDCAGSGLGSSLMAAFAQQAEAEYFLERSAGGRAVSLRKSAD